MARLALLARFHRKADVCRAGRVCVSRRPFLEMPGNLTGSRQYFKIKILGRERQPGNLSFPFCFFSKKFYCRIFKAFETILKESMQNSFTGPLSYQDPEKRATGPEKPPGPSALGQKILNEKHCPLLWPKVSDSREYKWK